LGVQTTKNAGSAAWRVVPRPEERRASEGAVGNRPGPTHGGNLLRKFSPSQPYVAHAQTKLPRISRRVGSAKSLRKDPVMLALGVLWVLRSQKTQADKQAASQ